MSVVLTEAAAEKVQGLLEKEEQELNLRVFVSGGGCSGFQYGFTFDDEIKDNDTAGRDNSNVGYRRCCGVHQV